MMYGWLIMALIFLLLELGSPGLFFFLSFLFGALVAAGITLFTELLVVHVVGFFIASGLAFLGLNYWLKKEHKHAPKTNVYALQGKRGVVTQTITAYASGDVKIGGEHWAAKSVDMQSIAQGSLVEVVRVQGVHVIVVKVESQ